MHSKITYLLLSEVEIFLHRSTIIACTSARLISVINIPFVNVSEYSAISLSWRLSMTLNCHLYWKIEINYEGFMVIVLA